jgi:branched-chain amino acid transport system substrate-binding protein
MRFKKASALFIALAVVGVACGDDSNSGSSATNAPAASAAPGGTTAPAAAGGSVVIATDLPLQGASHDASTDTNNAIALLLEQTGGKAGNYTVTMKTYDDSTAAKGGWDDATCAKNANDHVANTAEVAVMGTYNSGCAKIEVPVLNQDPSGPMLMVSHANTNPGLTKAWDPGEPDKYYPNGTRNYARIIATDDFQGQADAQFAKQDLKVTKCVVLNDAQTYGVGVATAFKDEAKKQGIEIVADEAWDAKQPNYTALFEGFKSLNPDCVFLGGINDNNGEQLIRDKVAVLGANDGTVKLIAPDGFTGYPTVQKLTSAACTSPSPVFRLRSWSRPAAQAPSSSPTSRPSMATIRLRRTPSTAQLRRSTSWLQSPLPTALARASVTPPSRARSPFPLTSRSSARSSASTRPVAM